MTPTTAIAPTPRITQIRERLEAYTPKFTDALAGRVPVELFVRVALSAMQGDPTILACSDASILLALMHAAALGLVPDGASGLASLVPFGKRCALLPSYRGYQALARRAAAIEIEAVLVHDGDRFQVRRGTRAGIDHEPDYSGQTGCDDGSLDGVVAVYAVATWPDGRQKFEVLDRTQILRARAMAALAHPRWAGGPRRSGSGPCPQRSSSDARPPGPGRATRPRWRARPPCAGWPSNLPTSGDFGRATALEHAVDACGEMPPPGGRCALACRAAARAADPDGSGPRHAAAQRGTRRGATAGRGGLRAGPGHPDTGGARAAAAEARAGQRCAQHRGREPGVMTTFFVPGLPKPQGSKRAFVRNGKPILAESAGVPLQDWRTSVAVVASAHFPDGPLHRPVAATIAFHLPRPKSLPRRVHHHTKRPDLDKLTRAVLDALQGVAVRDDAQVWRLDVRKQYARDGKTGAVIRVVAAAADAEGHAPAEDAEPLPSPARRSWSRAAVRRP